MKFYFVPKKNFCYIVLTFFSSFSFYLGTSLTSPDISNDCFIAKELLKEDEEKFKLEQQREFEFLQVRILYTFISVYKFELYNLYFVTIMFKAQYGMDNEGNFREQSIKNMQKAVYSGELTVSDFYEKQIELKMAETCGVDDGTSCLSGNYYYYYCFIF